MTPEMVRALRLNPRLRKRLRELQEALLAAVAKGDAEEIRLAAESWAEAERDAARDLEHKTAHPPLHRVTFLVSESYYEEFCQTALEYDLTPDEVARRYCASGHTFSRLFWRNTRDGGNPAFFGKLPGGLTVAQLVLPNFNERKSL